jgi:hypothetical protein
MAAAAGVRKSGVTKDCALSGITGSETASAENNRIVLMAALSSRACDYILPEHGLRKEDSVEGDKTFVVCRGR